jgi:uncharacterized glyoxalase superfamily protein PhnB
MPETAGSTVIPSLRYRDAPAAITWLCDVLGFTRKAVYEGPDNTIAHAELTFGSGMIMLGSASNANPYPHTTAHPDEIGGRTTSAIYVIVPDCNPLWERVRLANADVLQPLRTMDYGGQAFTVRDPEGYAWAVGEYDPWKAQS